MSELLSHPLDPLGARAGPPQPEGRGFLLPFALRSASTIALGVRLVGWRATPSVYGLPRPARGTTPRERRFKSDPASSGGSLIGYGLQK
jgi:hypothetical protein